MRFYEVKMKAEFICHKDFENELPIDVFHKEMGGDLPDESD
jgi:hypothetical protein